MEEEEEYLEGLEEEGLLSEVEGRRGAAEAWERDLAVWLGFAGAWSGSSSSSSSSSEEEGRSPGLATFWPLRLMAASFLALVAARRCSRVRVGLSGSSSSEDSDEDSLSSSSEDESFGAWGSWVGH